MCCSSVPTGFASLLCNVFKITRSSFILDFVVFSQRLFIFGLEGSGCKKTSFTVVGQPPLAENRLGPFRWMPFDLGRLAENGAEVNLFLSSVNAPSWSFPLPQDLFFPFRVSVNWICKSLRGLENLDILANLILIWTSYTIWEFRVHDGFNFSFTHCTAFNAYNVSKIPHLYMNKKLIL